MPQQKHTTKTRTGRKSRSSNTARKSKITLTKSQDVIAKVRALEKLGLYKPAKKITRQSITRSQKYTALKKFKLLQQNKVIRQGRAIPPLQRTMHGYKLNKQFALAKGKVKTSRPGIIKTRKGAIISSDFGDHPKILKNGTIQTYTTINGKRRKIYADILTIPDAMKFINDAENDTLKFPTGYAAKVIMFGNSLSYVIISDPAAAVAWARQYSAKLKLDMEKHQDATSPIEIEWIPYK